MMIKRLSHLEPQHVLAHFALWLILFRLIDLEEQVRVGEWGVADMVTPGNGCGEGRGLLLVLHLLFGRHFVLRIQASNP
jgi:hypothetical protein